LALADHVFAFQQWTADSLVQECGVDPAKVSVALPGANLQLDTVPVLDDDRGVPTHERPLVMGFVGKDWERKGLRFQVEIARVVRKLGLPVVVRCAGGCPPDLQQSDLVDYVGFLNKRADLSGFVSFLQGCDLGCLFSTAEASSIAILEFLRAGVPVAGFVIDGMGDLLKPEAALRFRPDQSAQEIGRAIVDQFSDAAELKKLRQRARQVGGTVTWQHSLGTIGDRLARNQPAGVPCA
jgi:glycosyltransferase involved in cell wall biosynthesis